jgi:hypothetical protein
MLFDRITAILEAELPAAWVDCLDGPDERYWDLGAGSGRLTLHLQHYLGISLYPTGGADADADSVALLDQAQALLMARLVP